MKRIVMVVLGVLFLTTAVTIGTGIGKEASWGNKSGVEYLTELPSVPGDLCSADTAEIEQFQSRYAAVVKELDRDTAERHRLIQQSQDENSKKMMENAVAMPGFEGKSQDEMKNMSTAERRKMAEQMMAEKFGVTPDELKAQKKANDEGNVMANVDWAKAMSGEMQAEEMMKSKAQRDADKKNLTDIPKLMAEQSTLTPYVQGLRSKFRAKVTELEQDPEGLEIKKQIETEEKKLEKMQRDSKSDCHALNDQKDVLVSKQREYCAFYSPRYKEILNDYKTDILSALPKHDRLDEVASELQTAQVGVPLSDASIGLNSLETVKDYADLLGNIYHCNVGTAEKNRGHFCDGL